MKGALDVHGALLAADVPHEVVRLKRAVLSADDLPAALDLAPEDCVAVRCYTVEEQDGSRRLVAAAVRAGCVPDPVCLLDALRVRSLRAATVAEVNTATEYAALLVSPVALPPDVVLLADASLTQREVLYVPSGEGRVAVGLRSADLLAATGARALRLGARPTSPAERPGWDASLRGPAGPLAPVIDLRGRGAATSRTGPSRRPAG